MDAPHRSGDRVMAKKMIRPIRNETEYDEALDEIKRYVENEPKPARRKRIASISLR
jgi:antitoxin component HigA of HigAB toxin-antitoxin module